MSGYLPQGTTLQLSNTAGDISHQGVLASNLSGTTNLTASSSNFPSSSTGTSVGHYHYTDASTKSLKFLNASGSGAGGHEFWISDVANVPVKTFDVNKDRAIIDTSLRNTSNKTILDTSNNTLTFYDSLGTSYTTMYSNSYQITNEPENVSLGFTNNNVYVVSSDSNNNVSTRIYLGQFQNTDLTLSNQSVLTTTYLDINKLNTIQKSLLTSENLSITDLSSNVSILTSTDLTFNGISLKTQIETNEDNIAKNKILNTVSASTFSSPAIYADAKPPIQCPSSITNTYPFFGWYFINSFSSGTNKINWYLPPKNATFKVSDLLGFYLKLFNVSTTSNDNTPFITVYTKVDSLTPNYASWYKSRNTYIITATPTINTHYTFLFQKDGDVPTPQSYNTNIIPLSPSPVNNPRGSYAPTEDILFFSIGTNSASPLNSVEFIAQKFGVMSIDGTTEFEFMPLLN